MAGASLDYVDRVLQGHSAKGITALAWKAGCSMRVALQLQTNMGGIPPNKALHARDGSDFPLTPKAMEWQLDFFASLEIGGASCRERGGRYVRISVDAVTFKTKEKKTESKKQK